MLYINKPLGFSIEIPDAWRVASFHSPTLIPGYTAQAAEDDLPAAGDLRGVLIAQEIVMAKDIEGVPYEQVPNHLEINVWKDQPFKLPTRAKKFPLGTLAFKARLLPYGVGGQHAAGQLDMGNGLVLHLTLTSDSPAALERMRAVLATGKRLG